MFSIENYYKEIKSLFEYEDYQNLQKRLIDLTLDTEDVSFYRKTLDFLDWLDHDNKETLFVLEKYRQLYDILLSALADKDISKKKKLLEVQNLTKSYTHSRFSLGPISFDILQGEIIGLVGENGNGKTTLLRSLCGELSPSSGSVNYMFDYKDNYDLRSRLIYIPQRTKDWHGSLLTNLYFTAASYGIKGEENKLLVELVIARMGLRSYRDLSWKNLSSGYKMRFELARMLLRKPKLLLIDEPLANLDIVAQQVVLDDFKAIAKSPFRPLGIVLSSQQLYEVEKTSDHVIFLKDGKPNTETFDNKTATDLADIPKLIIEFESEWGQDELRLAFSSLNLEKLQIKGGTYIAIFAENTSQHNFLETIVDKNISLNYFRNISQSTRRFFLS